MMTAEQSAKLAAHYARSPFNLAIAAKNTAWEQKMQFARELLDTAAQKDAANADLYFSHRKSVEVSVPDYVADRRGARACAAHFTSKARNEAREEIQKGGLK